MVITYCSALSYPEDNAILVKNLLEEVHMGRHPENLGFDAVVSNIWLGEHLEECQSHVCLGS